MKIFKRKEKLTENDNTKLFSLSKEKTIHVSILDFFGFNSFNHETHFTDFVAENNANLYNRLLAIHIY